MPTSNDPASTALSASTSRPGARLPSSRSTWNVRPTDGTPAVSIAKIQ